MTPNEIAALWSRIQSISNPTVRKFATTAYNQAGNAAESFGYERLQQLLDKSAKVDGKTAIFYSGDRGANEPVGRISAFRA